LEPFQPPGEPGVPEDPEGEALSTPLRERPDAPLGTLIFRAGLLPAETIENALEEGVKTGKRLGEILTERGLIQEADLARLLAGQKGLNFVTLREQIVDPAAAGLFSEDQARLFRALPYAFEDGVPVVAIADPTDEVLTRNVREALAREDARFVVSIRSELADIIGEVYAAGVAPAPAPAPAPHHEEAPAVPDTTGSDPGQVPAEAVHTADVPAPQPPPAVEPPAPEPVAEAPVPAEPAVPDTPGSDPDSGPEGQVQAPVEPAVNGHHEDRPVAPEVLAAPQFEIVHAPQPEVPAPEPVAAPAPEPVPAPAPEHIVAEPVAAEPPAAEPIVAETHPQPVPAPVAPAPAEPAEPQPAPAPAPESAPAAAVPAPEPQVQPAPVAAVAHRLSVRLTNGERVEMGAFDDLEAAKAAAKALMAQVAAADGGDWPFVSGRFLKPETIVSVDIS
jgi:Type II secretion system (T2SS), protein E, N-terminal domain